MHSYQFRYLYITYFYIYLLICMRMPITLTMDPELVDKIDRDRDDLPRCRWLERAARRYLEERTSM